MKKYILGIIISITFIFLAIRGVEYDTVVESLSNVSYKFMVPTIILFTSLLFLKSLRWGLILAPVEHIGQKAIFPITCVGFMAIALVPMRGGEIVRPYLITTISKVPMSSSLATVFVERVMDSATLIFILILVLLGAKLPDILMDASYTFVFSVIIIIIISSIFYYKFDTVFSLLNPLLRKLPENIKTKVEEIAKNFSEGFKIVSDPKRFTYTLFLSLLIWIVSGCGIYTLFLFHNFSLPLSSAYVVLIVTMIGISLPAAPGFLGNFQFGCILALSIFNIPKSDALAFSMTYYILAMGITIIFGLIFLPSTRFSLKDIKKRFNMKN